MTSKKIFSNLLKSSFLVFIVIMVSCKTHQSISIPNPVIETSFNESYKTWNKEKKVHQDSYQYEVGFSSWVGYRNTTKIEVENGQVVSRTFLETQQHHNEKFSEKEILIFEESGTTVNTHKSGFKAVTIDQIYQNCGTISLQANEEMNHIFFAVDELGILKSCSFGQKNCTDDCSQGVNIYNFKWLK